MEQSRDFGEDIDLQVTARQFDKNFSTKIGKQSHFNKFRSREGWHAG